ncbi:MAG: YcxB family protein [Spirochaetia bacterium]|nr:YcxB family protein [Spirochaetia bacterium]
MTIKITLDVNDYLTYHLYLASKSDSLKKRRLIHWFIIPIVYVIAGYAFVYLNGAEMIKTIFLATALIWFLIYPFYSKWAIRRFLTRQIIKRYENLIDKEGSLKLDDKKITVKSHDASMDFDYKDIKDIIELSNHFLIDLKVASSLILPKHKIPDEILAKVIDKIIDKTGLTPKIQTLWGWK